MCDRQVFNQKDSIGKLFVAKFFFLLKTRQIIENEDAYPVHTLPIS